MSIKNTAPLSVGLTEDISIANSDSFFSSFSEAESKTTSDEALDKDFFGRVGIAATDIFEIASSSFEAINGDDTNNTLSGTSGNDSLNGYGGNDIIIGNDGDDLIYDGSGRDTVLGGDGDDKIYMQGGDNLSSVSISGGIISSASGAFWGEGGRDTFVIEDEDQTTTGGINIDGKYLRSTIIDFDPGVDKIDLRAFSKVKNISQLKFSSASYLGLVSFLLLYVEGDLGGQYITLANISASELSSSDFIFYGTSEKGGSTKADKIYGTDYGDDFEGLDGNDLILGYGGSDNILGGYGNDKIYGGSGNDFLYGDAGNDAIYGEADDDFIEGGAGNDKIYGGLGNDTINGGDGKDAIYGDEGNDIIDAGSEDNKVYGGEGDDNITSGSGKDKLYGGNGNDTINSGYGDDLIYADGGDDAVNAGGGKDKIYGGSGNDTLNGQDGNDIIYGVSGSNTINGGAGVDKLYGGTGVDHFSFSSLSDSILIGSLDGKKINKTNLDLIFNFISGVDKIDLSEINDSIIGTEDDINFSSLDIVVKSGLTIVKDHNSDFAFSIKGAINLTETDFIF